MIDYEKYLTPEQVAERLQMGTETVYRYLRAGKLRGRRISHKAWRIGEIDLASFMRGQNISELLFEQYLAEQGLEKADHEPEFPGATKRIDYRLLHNGKRLWFEVKEFADDLKLFVGQRPGEVRGGAYDPYESIRSKIDRAKEKFREYKGECCSLVLFNERANLVDIYVPDIVLGAMLGNIQFNVPLDLETGEKAGPTTRSFGRGGKITVSHEGKAQNTTISAVIAVERLHKGQREQRIRFARKELQEELQQAGPLSWEERLERRKPIPSDEEIVLRTIICDNPHAANPLPHDIFRGNFDERWSHVDGKIAPIYVGDRLMDLERREQELDLHLGPLQRYLKQSEEVHKRRGNEQ